MYAIQNKDGWFFSGLKSYATIFGYYSSDHPMTTHVYKRYLEDAALFGGDPLRFTRAVDRLRTTGPALVKFLRSPESVHPTIRENIIDNIQNLNE